MKNLDFTHIERTDLKEMYIYVGPIVYNDKLFRVFRTRTPEHDYVFYNDDNGVLTLPSLEEIRSLMSILMSGGDVIDEENYVVIDAVEDEKPKRIPGKIQSKDYKIPVNFGGKSIELEIKVNVEESEDGRVPDSFLSQIQSVIDVNVKRLQSLSASPECIEKAVKNLDKLVINYSKDVDKFAAGRYRITEHEVKLLDDNWDNNKTLSHELFHAMSSGKENTESCGLENKTRRLGASFNEAFTEMLANPEGYKNIFEKDVNISYRPYVKTLAKMFEEITPEMIDAYISNDFEKFKSIACEKFGISPEDFEEFTMRLDLDISIYQREDSSKHETDTYYAGRRDSGVFTLKMNEQEKNGKPVTIDTMKQVIENNHLELNGYFISTIITDEKFKIEDIMELANKYHIELDKDHLNHINSLISDTANQFGSVNVYKNQVNKDEKKALIKKAGSCMKALSSMEFSPVSIERNVIPSYETSDEVISMMQEKDEDVNYFFANSTALIWQLQNYEKIKDNYSDKTKECLYGRIINTVKYAERTRKGSFERQESNFYTELAKEQGVFKDIVETSLDPNYPNRDSHIPIQNGLFHQLDDKDKEEVIRNTCAKFKEAEKDGKRLNSQILEITRFEIDEASSEERPLPTRELADLVYETVTHDMGEENYINFFEVKRIYTGYDVDEKELFEKTCKTMFGEDYESEYGGEIDPEDDYEDQFDIIQAMHLEKLEELKRKKEQQQQGDDAEERTM